MTAQDRLNDAQVAFNAAQRTFNDQVLAFTRLTNERLSALESKLGAPAHDDIDLLKKLAAIDPQSLRA